MSIKMTEAPTEATFVGTLGVDHGGTGTATAFTQGSIVFAGAAGTYSQDNANLFWDGTNHRLGLGIATPSYPAHIRMNGASGSTVSDASTILLLEDGTNGDNFAITALGKGAGTFDIRFDSGSGSDLCYIRMSASSDAIQFIAGNTTQLTLSQSAGSAVFVKPISCNSTTTTGNLPMWIKITKVYADFSTAATTNSINLYSLPAGATVHACKIKHSTAFSGTGIASYTVSVGLSGNNAKYATAFDVFQAVGNTVLQTTNVVGTENQAASTQLTATATSTGANLNAAAGTGSVDIWLLISTAT